MDMPHRPLPFFGKILLPALICLMAACVLPGMSRAAAQTPIRAAAPEESNAAADTDAVKRMAERMAVKAGATPIAILHEGTDNLGAKLSYQLKETVNAGTLFALNDKDEPKLQIMLSTAPEFPSRPGVGSLYCIVWAYSERPTVLSSYLAQEVGIITRENLGELADKLISRTSGLVAKHSYIFNN
jgi:hypothetical protein